MRLELSAYADLHTLQERIPAVPTKSFISVLMVRTRSLYAGALALVLIVAGGTQASLAAEDAVPGDVLYPIKVALSEPLAMTLAISSEQKAELSARFASRRVTEATQLSSEGKLDEKTADELATRFDTHVDALAKETQSLEANGDIAVSLAVRTDLEQKVSAQAEDLAVSNEAPASDTVVMKMAVASEDPEDTFSARIFEKSRSLATTRERLDSALALDSSAEADASVDLAVLRHPTEDSEGGQSSLLFFAKQPVAVVSSTTATSTATTTPVEQATTTNSSPASRFFSPFLKR